MHDTPGKRCARLLLGIIPILGSSVSRTSLVTYMTTTYPGFPVPVLDNGLQRLWNAGMLERVAARSNRGKGTYYRMRLSPRGELAREDQELAAADTDARRRHEATSDAVRALAGMVTA